MAKPETFIRPEDLDDIDLMLVRLNDPYCQDRTNETTIFLAGQREVGRQESANLLTTLKDLGLIIESSLEDPMEFNLSLEPLTFGVEEGRHRMILRFPLRPEFKFTPTGLLELFRRTTPKKELLDTHLALQRTYETTKDKSGQVLHMGRFGGRNLDSFFDTFAMSPASVKLETYQGSDLNYGMFVTNPDIVTDPVIEFYLPNNRYVSKTAMDHFAELSEDVSQIEPSQRMDYASILAQGFNAIRVHAYQNNRYLSTIENDRLEKANR